MHLLPVIRSALSLFALGAALFLVLPAGFARASGISAPHVERKALQELYGGIVANDTITSAGEDFYRDFVALWRERPLSDRYALAIHERPSARWGSTIWIEYAQRRVFQAQLPPSRAAVKAISTRAVNIAAARVVDAEVGRLLFRDPDLGPDEL